MLKGIIFILTWIIVTRSLHITKMNSEVTVYDSELSPDEHLSLQGTKKLSKGNIEHIIFKNCSGVIGSSTLKHFSNLQKLTFWKSNIKTIDSVLPITHLISVGSHLPNFDEQFQTKLPKIRNLFLLGNKEFTVNPLIFKKFKSLITLSISEANFTEDCITKQWFKDMTQLEELILSDNNLNCITDDAFNNLKNLRKLDLTYNKLNKLDRKIFKKLTKLEFLGLYENNIEVFDVNSFDSQKKHLEGLGISWSLLRNVEADDLLNILPNLKWVSFGHDDMPNDFKAGVFCQILLQKEVSCSVDNMFGVSKILGYSI